MELFDFYKLLDLPIGTPIGDIKKAYILRVHQYSEAYNGGEEKAAEYLQIITQGYQLLSDPEKKRVYDLMLLSHYLKRKDSDINRSLYKKYGSSERNPTKDEAEEDHSSKITKGEPKELTLDQIEIARKGVQKEKQQLFIGVLLVALLFVVFDYIFWKPYMDLTMISYTLLLLSYVISIIWILMKLYRYFEVRNLILQKKTNIDKWIMGIFFVLFFALPSFAIRIEKWRRDFHLTRYSVTTRAEDFMLEDNWLTVDYIANNKKLKQSIWLGDNAADFKKYNYDRMRFTIKYSKQNPKIIAIEPER